jgi:hypothetical protein
VATKNAVCDVLVGVTRTGPATMRDASTTNISRGRDYRLLDPLSPRVLRVSFVDLV